MVEAKISDVGRSVSIKMKNTEDLVFGRIVRLSGITTIIRFSVIYTMTPHGTFMKSSFSDVSWTNEKEEIRLKELENDVLSLGRVLYPGFSAIIELCHPDEMERIKNKYPFLS